MKMSLIKEQELHSHKDPWNYSLNEERIFRDLFFFGNAFFPLLFIFIIL